MLHPPGFYYVKKPKRFVILSSDKSSERNLSYFFDIIKPRRMEHLQSEEPFSSDPYFKWCDELKQPSDLVISGAPLILPQAKQFSEHKTGTSHKISSQCQARRNVPKSGRDNNIGWA